MKLAKLTKVDIREVWKHEAKDFTTWLSRPENLEILGESLGLELEPLEQESKVGKYSADILAKDISSGRTVIIENQLEDSNHDHLGKCITYAAGKEAAVVVWIVRKANEEHRKAIEWLNERTDDELAFFLVEIEALKIGDSAVASHFNIIECPNEWARAAKRSAAGVSELNQQYQKFWTSFAEYAKTRDDFRKEFRTTKPSPQNWMSFASFASGCQLTLVCSSYNKKAIAKVYISQHSPFLETFVNRYGEVEDALDIKFDCGTAKDKTFSVATDFDIETDEVCWKACFKWFCDMLLKLKPEVVRLTK